MVCLTAKRNACKVVRYHFHRFQFFSQWIHPDCDTQTLHPPINLRSTVTSFFFRKAALSYDFPTISVNHSHLRNVYSEPQCPCIHNHLFSANFSIFRKRLFLPPSPGRCASPWSCRQVAACPLRSAWRPKCWCRCWCGKTTSRRTTWGEVETPTGRRCRGHSYEKKRMVKKLH